MKASRQTRAKLTLLGGDLLLLVSALSLGTYLRVQDLWFSFYENRLATVFFVVVSLLCLFLARGYEVQPQASATKALQKPSLGLIGAMIATAVFFYLAPSIRFGRWIFTLAYLIALFSILGWRLTYFLLQRRHSLAILVMGDPGWAGLAQRLVREFSPRSTVLVWQPDLNANEIPDGQFPNGGPVDEANLDLAILAGHARDAVVIRKAAALRLNGVEVWDLLRLSAEFAERLPARLLDEHWLATAEGFRSLSDRSFRAGKRLLDIFLAVGGLLLTSPLLAVAALAIKLQDGGKVIYSQERLGRGERPFRVYKLRTMISSAEAISGPVWASGKDPRVTRAGRWLRRLRFDEIPQMWNVLKGEMSCVGPRPERPCFATELKAKYPYYAYRHLVRPGITGWAQIRCPYAASEEATLRKLEYDLYYVQNASFLFDLRIILKTISIVASAWGSR